MDSRVGNEHMCSGIMASLEKMCVDIERMKSRLANGNDKKYTISKRPYNDSQLCQATVLSIL